ncbi:hypothetical protein BBP40_001286 [Aspergillus hancockii]|nr:hypothetical protein BBP40_001286 [Aspergillus hancockii]
MSQSDLSGMVSPTQSSNVGGRETNTNSSSESRSFIASDSVLYEEMSPSRPDALPRNDWRRTEEHLRRKCPRASTHQLEEPLRQAMLDSFTESFSHWYPLIDISRITHDTSRVLENTLIMAGSLARRIETVEDLLLPWSLYQQSKEMIYASNGRDLITLLKAICIIACWNLRPPSVISLDGPWHWAGITTRLALQIGMHRETTYSRLEDSSSCRRIWWHLVNSDVLQAACWGGPCLFRLQNQDVQLPQQSNSENILLQVFIQTTRLLVILRQAVELDISSPSDIVAALAGWHQNIPLPLKLYDITGYRNSYNKPINEMYILYFAIIIHIFFRHEVNEGHRARVSRITIAAFSCMVQLYEEIYHREQSNRLHSVHGFFLMLAAVPQIFHRAQTPDKERLREKELEIVCSVLRQLRVKYGGSNMVLQKVLKLISESQTNTEQDLITETQGEPTELFITRGEILDSVSLFPFPLEFSPNLDLLNAGIPDNERQEESIIDLLTFESSLIDWSVDGSTDFQAWTPTDFA